MKMPDLDTLTYWNTAAQLAVFGAAAVAIVTTLLWRPDLFLLNARARI